MNDRKTILFVHNSNDLYGADIILLNLIQGLDRRRYRAIVVLPEDVRHINRLSARLEVVGISYRFLPLGVIRRKYFGAWKIWKCLLDMIRGVAILCVMIRKENIDIVHSNTLTVYAGAIAAKLTGRPHVWHIHEISTSGKWARTTLHAIVRYLSDQIVVVSDAVRRHILQDEPQAAGKVRTIHNGIDLLPYTCGRNTHTFREELDIPEDARVVGMVGRVSRWKGQSIFVEAARNILKEVPDVYFLAVGGVFDKERQYMEAFRRLVASYRMDRFKICDFRQDIPSVLAGLDIFVLPSILPDPFPTVIIEAMAAGLPVIGSDCGGVPEMIVNGETGILVKPGDPDALAGAITSLLNNPEETERMGANARAQALKAFQIDRFVREFETIYDELVEASS